MLKTYQKYVSHLFGRTCRFYPTCSQYSIEAVETFGCFKGTLMALWRILRCNPLSRGGEDKVKHEVL